MTQALALHTHQGFKITVRPATERSTCAQVAVFDPRFPRSAPLYKSISVDDAKKWIDHYCRGSQWAVDGARR